MRLPSMALAAAAAAALSAGCAPAGSDAPEAAADPSESTWVLDVEDCANRPGRRATAFVTDVGDGPVLVTAAHALDGARSVSAIDPAGTAVGPLTVRLVDGELDIAVLSAPAAAQPLALSLDARPATAALWTRRDADDTAEAIEVDVLRWVDVELDGEGKRPGLELARGDAAEANDDLVQSGDSGAPVTDPADDRVIGMVFAAARTGERGWATAASALHEALTRASGDGTIHLTCEQ